MAKAEGGGRRRLGKSVVIGVAFALLLLVLIVYASNGLTQHTCEVCVTFGPGTECRTADGSTVEEATRTATSSACAGLASGMTDTINCTNTPPQKVNCN